MGPVKGVSRGQSAASRLRQLTHVITLSYMAKGPQCLKSCLTFTQVTNSGKLRTTKTTKAMMQLMIISKAQTNGIGSDSSGFRLRVP